MRKKIANRCFFGAPAGVMLQVLVTLWGSYMRGDGRYGFVSGHLILVYGTELNAVTAQYIGAMLVGMIWSAASLIYQEMEGSLLKQTVVHGMVCIVPSLLIAYAMQWMPHSLNGLVQYLTLFGGIYVLIWMVQYAGMKKRIRQINTQLEQMREKE